MQLFDLLREGMALALSPLALLFSFVGVILGILFGAMPGLSAFTALAVLLPLTFTMSPENAIILFLAIYVGSQFGNSLPAVLMRTPGTPASVMTAIEGYPFQQRGEGARALGVCLTSSIFGQLFAFVSVAILILPLARFSVKFISPEVFALAVFGLVAAASLVGRDPVKGIVSTAIGLALATVGPDPISGVQRFNFGIKELQTGLEAVPLIVGLLVVAELIGQSGEREHMELVAGTDIRHSRRIWPTLRDLVFIRRATIIGSITGFITGMIPGIGAAGGSFIAYQQARVFAHEPKKFGGTEGSLEALAAADSANNASTGGEFVPTLGLGIPGGPAMIIVIAALQLHGIIPGPGLFQSRPGTLEAVVGGLIVACLFMAILGYLSIRPAVYLVSLSRESVLIVALVTSLIGIYAIRWNLFDVAVALAAGGLGVILTKFHYPMAPAALGFILGPIVESNLRRGLVLSYNNPLTFIGRPIVLVLLAIGATLFAYSMWSKGKENQLDKTREKE